MLRKIEFYAHVVGGPSPNVAELYLGALGEPWTPRIGGEPRIVKALSVVGASASRGVAGSTAAPAQFIGFRSRFHDDFCVLGVSAEPRTDSRLVVEVCAPQQSQFERPEYRGHYIAKILHAAFQATAASQVAATLRFDHAIWHGVDSKLRRYRLATSILAGLSTRDWSGDSDEAIAIEAARLWNAFE